MRKRCNLKGRLKCEETTDDELELDCGCNENNVAKHHISGEGGVAKCVAEGSKKKEGRGSVWNLACPHEDGT